MAIPSVIRQRCGEKTTRDAKVLGRNVDVKISAPESVWARWIVVYIWWLIPLTKWIISQLLSGLTLLSKNCNSGYNLLSKWDEPASILR